MNLLTTMVSRSQHAVMCVESITRQARAIARSICSKQFMSHLAAFEYHSAVVTPISLYQVCEGCTGSIGAHHPTSALGPKAWRIAAKDTQRVHVRVHDAIDDGVVLDRKSGGGTHSLGGSRAWWSSPGDQSHGIQGGVGNPGASLGTEI